jgi:hypothetical protein
MKQFMEDDDSQPAAVAAPVCRLLRTKNAFGTNVGYQNSWQSGDSSTAVYWCLKTMEICGPDESYAHPHSCCAGRACFRSDEE